MAAVAAGSGYDARSLPFATPAGTWSAGQWGQYPSCYPSNGLQDTLATQQDPNNGMYLSGFHNAMSAQALGQVPPRRKCGRPKAPNPLEDPNIPEKKARRIMANRASADRSKQRAKLAAAQAKAEIAALKTQLSDVSRQLTDTDDCLTVLELVQCAIGGLPAPQGALYSLQQQLGGSRDRAQGKAPQQRGTKRKLQAMQYPSEQPVLPGFSEGMPVLQPVLQPQQQQEPQRPQHLAAAWQAVQPPAMAFGANPAPPAAATAACMTQGSLASQLSFTAPAATAALMYDTPMASSMHMQNPPPQQQQKTLDVLTALKTLLEPLQEGQQQGQQQQQARGWQQLMPLAADGMQHHQQQQQQPVAMTTESSRAGVSDLEQLLQQLVSRVVRS